MVGKILLAFYEKMTVYSQGVKIPSYWEEIYLSGKIILEP